MGGPLGAQITQPHGKLQPGCPRCSHHSPGTGEIAYLPLHAAGSAETQPGPGDGSVRTTLSGPVCTGQVGCPVGRGARGRPRPCLADRIEVCSGPGPRPATPGPWAQLLCLCPAWLLPSVSLPAPGCLPLQAPDSLSIPLPHPRASLTLAMARPPPHGRLMPLGAGWRGGGVVSAPSVLTPGFGAAVEGRRWGRGAASITGTF